MKQKNFSRRRFLKLGSVAAATASGGLWIRYSNVFPARFLRERCAEIGRQVQAPKFKPTPAKWNENTITAAWLGHSTVLLNFYGVTILTDPVLFSRVGASVGFGTLGPKRVIAPALGIKELPPIDLILLSHAHLDHMDMPTLRRLGNSSRVVTALDTAELLKCTKLPPARELGWGDKTTLQTDNGEIEIEAFEVNHWGGRWGRKGKQRGYNGYIISREGKKIIFGGDTAMCDSFGELRSRGPFEMALMPIGAYNPWIFAHCSPEQAVEMSNAAGARYILPIHHQAFALSREPFNEPIERFEMALQQEAQRIALRDVGETFSLKI